jgi:hypothetical protein
LGLLRLFLIDFYFLALGFIGFAQIYFDLFLFFLAHGFYGFAQIDFD